MKKDILFIVACITACSILMSCKKENISKPVCKIITASDASSGSNVYNFTYNSSGQLSSFSQGTSTTTFAYSGSTVIATTTNSGTFSYKNIITLNANGLASDVKTENDPSGTTWNNQAFDYSGTELIKVTTTSSSGGAPSISTFTWSNGNMMSLTSGSSTTTLDYFTDKTAQAGDYLQFIQLVTGYEIYKSKNVLKSVVAGSGITSFDYTYDADGKITSMNITSGSSVETINYQYQCT